MIRRERRMQGVECEPEGKQLLRKSSPPNRAGIVVPESDLGSGCSPVGAFPNGCRRIPDDDVWICRRASISRRDHSGR
jgi:hypothetical protein